MTEDTRKGFLTPEQEKQIDGLVKLSGVAEALDGPAISLADNQGLERLKPAILAKWPDALPIIYELIDAILASIPVVKEV
jgi:hypothetical protein